MVKKYITDDGYVFVVMPDGTLTDGDMSFNNLEHLYTENEHSPSAPTVFEYTGNRNPLMPNSRESNNVWNWR